MTSVLDPSTINIDQLLGVILICLILAAYLFGMSSSQAYIYYDRFPKDPWYYKTLVGVVWVLDSLHTALMSHTAYYYTVTNFGNYVVLDQPPVFSFNLEILVVPILAFIVQTFFAHRAWAIENKHWPLSVGIETFAVCQLIFGIIACVIAFTKFDGFLNLEAHTWALIAWLSTATIANLMVTVSLLWSFWANKTSFAEDDSWATKVLMYGVHTGLFTTITTIADLCFVIAWPDTLAFAGLNYILGKLYTNTLLYALNRRPISDPRYQSSTSSKAKSHNLSSIIPGANPHSLSAPPRVLPKDPYAADYAVDIEINATKKAYPFGEGPDEEGERKVQLDEQSEPDSAYIPQDKHFTGARERGDVENQHPAAF